MDRPRGRYVWNGLVKVRQAVGHCDQRPGERSVVEVNYE